MVVSNKTEKISFKIQKQTKSTGDLRASTRTSLQRLKRSQSTANLTYEPQPTVLEVKHLLASILEAKRLFHPGDVNDFPAVHDVLESIDESTYGEETKKSMRALVLTMEVTIPLCAAWHTLDGSMQLMLKHISVFENRELIFRAWKQGDGPVIDQLRRGDYFSFLRDSMCAVVGVTVDISPAEILRGFYYKPPSTDIALMTLGCFLGMKPRQQGMLNAIHLRALPEDELARATSCFRKRTEKATIPQQWFNLLQTKFWDLITGVGEGSAGRCLCPYGENE